MLLYRLKQAITRKKDAYTSVPPLQWPTECCGWNRGFRGEYQSGDAIMGGHDTRCMTRELERYRRRLRRRRL